MSLKVYLAAPWVAKERARSIADTFTHHGFEITKRWWDHREVPGYLTDDHSSDPELRQQAEEDIDGVLNADVFVLLNLEKSEGKAVETGVALLQGIPVILLGGKSNLFHYLDYLVKEAVSVEHAMELAREYALPSSERLEGHYRRFMAKGGFRQPALSEDREREMRQRHARLGGAETAGLCPHGKSPLVCSECYFERGIWGR